MKFLCKRDSACFLFITSNEETHRNKHLLSKKNERIFFIFNQIKILISRVPLPLRLQPL